MLGFSCHGFLRPPALQIETARAVVSEFGREATHKSGVYDWAKIDDKNSERDVSRTVQKHGITLQLPITDLHVGTRSLAWINPKDWLQFIVKHGLLYMLSGLSFEERDRVGQTWTQFWQQYRRLNPDFGIFDDPAFDPATTIGLYLHGDEGRTLKKSALMVTSLQSILGTGFDSKRLKRPKDNRKLQVNFAGHTFGTRFVVTVLPKTVYSDSPETFHKAMDKLAEEMKSVFQSGIRDTTTGVVYRFCLLGVKGDMPYLQKIGRLKRSWNTTVKRGRQKKEPPGVCHLCLGGTPRYPCEDTSHQPGWSTTIGVKVPWDTTPGILRILPHDCSNPGSFLIPDLWHCVHLGIGKSFIASTVQLALEVVPATNNDDRFDWLTSHYKTWCRSQKTSCHTSKISAYLVSYNDQTGATGNWSKGSLTANLMRWVVQLLTDLPADEQGLLSRCCNAAQSLNLAFSLLYNTSLFLDEGECRYVYQHGMVFVQAYSFLAEKAFEQGRFHLYPLYPKLHAIHHVWYTIREDLWEFSILHQPHGRVMPARWRRGGKGV